MKTENFLSAFIIFGNWEIMFRKSEGSHICELPIFLKMYRNAFGIMIYIR